VVVVVMMMPVMVVPIGGFLDGCRRMGSHGGGSDDGGFGRDRAKSHRQ
jgi:hypothetical protein